MLHLLRTIVQAGIAEICKCPQPHCEAGYAMRLCKSFLLYCRDDLNPVYWLGVESTCAQFPAVGMESSFRRLASLDGRVLVMLAEHDVLIDTPRVSDWLSNELPRAQVAVIDEVSHMIPWEQPLRLSAALANFFNHA